MERHEIEMLGDPSRMRRTPMTEGFTVDGRPSTLRVVKFRSDNEIIIVISARYLRRFDQALPTTPELYSLATRAPKTIVMKTAESMVRIMQT